MLEWYLIGQPTFTSGFENGSYNENKDDALNDLLNTEAAQKVTIFEHDLNDFFITRCLIQDKPADTYTQAVKCTAVFKIGTVKTGMYVYFDGYYWLVVSKPSKNYFYEKVELRLCQYLLKWQDDKKNIIERWIHLESGGSGIGESSSNVMTLLKYDYSFFIPYDNDTLKLDNKRVFIDTRTENPYKVFELTRSDDVPYQYGDNGGVLFICANRTELNTLTDNTELKICDYINPFPSPDPPDDKVITYISGNTSLIYNINQSYTCSFTNSKGEPISPDEVNYKWDIISDVKDKIHYYIKDTVLTMYVDNYDLLGQTLTLQVLVDDVLSASLNVTVMDII